MKEEQEKENASWQRKSERGWQVSGQTGEHDEQRRTWSPHRVHSAPISPLRPPARAPCRPRACLARP